MKADTLKEAEPYVTLNLLSALREFDKQASSKDDPFDFELTDEAPATPDVGGYLVGFRGVFGEGGQHLHAEGLFHLVLREGVWKIEDMLFTSFNRQKLEQGLSVARDYRQMLQPNGQLARGSTGPAATAQANSAKPSVKPFDWSKLNRFLLAGVVIAVLGALQKRHPNYGAGALR